MAKAVKERIMTYRVDEALGERIDEYVEEAGIGQSDLSRDAVIEYMANHPIKSSSGAASIAQPGAV